MMKHEVSWQVSAERRSHDLRQSRRAIVAARIRIVVAGHVLFLAACALLEAAGRLPAGLLSLGCWSLFVMGLLLIVFEWLHVKLQPGAPPRFVVRPSGLTEYGQDGPRAHWDWRRTCQLSIESDREQPAYRSLVLAMQNERALTKRFYSFRIPLPDGPQAGAGDTDAESVDERQIVAALCEAFERGRIHWEGRNGAVALLHQHSK